jgi:hypothetical protein
VGERGNWRVRMNNSQKPKLQTFCCGHELQWCSNLVRLFSICENSSEPQLGDDNLTSLHSGRLQPALFANIRIWCKKISKN